MKIGVKSLGSPEAVKPIHPAQGVNNPPARGNGDTAEISELAKSLKGIRIKSAINQLRCLSCDVRQSATPFQISCHTDSKMMTAIINGSGGIPFFIVYL
jgi:hypothetical protein